MKFSIGNIEFKFFGEKTHKKLKKKIVIDNTNFIKILNKTQLALSSVILFVLSSTLLHC